MARVVILGPAHPLRGGIASFNQRLAQQFTSEGHECSIVSFSLQYPSFLFPGKTQFTSGPAPEGMVIHTLVNSINPANWLLVGRKIRKWKPDIVVVRFWLPLMGPALGTILRIVRKNKNTRIICIADNVIPHESRPGDRPFTKYFLKPVDAFIVMSEKVMKDLRKFEQKKTALLIPHPLYDNFGTPLPKSQARDQLKLDLKEKIILFFGFIRHYKGLDLLLEAMADQRIREARIHLLIAGEFYEDSSLYLGLVQKLHLQDRVYLHTDFIPDDQVRQYLCAADCVVQPYRNATQSGVTPLAYHFEKPMIVTDVGGLPALVPHEMAGLICKPDPSSIADAILRFYQLGEDYFIPHLRTEKKKYAWENLTKAILELAQNPG